MMVVSGGGGGNNSSGDRGRSTRKKKGALESSLASALKMAHFDANTALRKQQEKMMMMMTQQVGTGTGTGMTTIPPPMMVDTNSIVVRVLKCENHFGLRIGLVSLMTPHIPAKMTLNPSSLMSPTPVLASHAISLSRFVAWVAGTQGTSIPPALLRMVIFPPSDLPQGVEHSKNAPIPPPKLNDFPTCYIRIRQPFGCCLVDQCVPILFNLISWDRIVLPEEIQQVENEEMREWEKESARSKALENRSRVEEEQLRAAESLVAKKGTSSAHVDDGRLMDDGSNALLLSESNHIDFSEDQSLSSGTLKEIEEARKEREKREMERRKKEAESKEQEGRIAATIASSSKEKKNPYADVDILLDFQESKWNQTYASYHPRSGLRPDEFHELLTESQEYRLPLSKITPYTDVGSFTLCGVVQKVCWRGVNFMSPSPLNPLGPSQIDATSSSSFAYDSNHPLPSFYIQDQSGRMVEVDIPFDQVHLWADVLAGGLGGWITLLDLQLSSRVSEKRTGNDSIRNMQRSFQPVSAKEDKIQPFVTLTVTGNSAYQLKHISNLLASPSTSANNTDDDAAAIKIPYLRDQSITPLHRLTQLDSLRSTRLLPRVNLFGKILHLNNHPRREWKLYLTDESLRIEGKPVTPTMVVLVTEQFHHQILDVFFQPNVYILLLDVCVEFDRESGLPVLRADEFTEMINPLPVSSSVEDEKWVHPMGTRPKIAKALRSVSEKTKYIGND